MIKKLEQLKDFFTMPYINYIVKWHADSPKVIWATETAKQFQKIANKIEEL